MGAKKVVRKKATKKVTKKPVTKKVINKKKVKKLEMEELTQLNAATFLLDFAKNTLNDVWRPIKEKYELDDGTHIYDRVTGIFEEEKKDG